MRALQRESWMRRTQFFYTQKKCRSSFVCHVPTLSHTHTQIYIRNKLHRQVYTSSCVSEAQHYQFASLQTFTNFQLYNYVEKFAAVGLKIHYSRSTDLLALLDTLLVGLQILLEAKISSSVSKACISCSTGTTTYLHMQLAPFVRLHIQPGLQAYIFSSTSTSIHAAPLVGPACLALLVGLHISTSFSKAYSSSTGRPSYAYISSCTSRPTHLVRPTYLDPLLGLGKFPYLALLVRLQIQLLLGLHVYLCQ